MTAIVLELRRDADGTAYFEAVKDDTCQKTWSGRRIGKVAFDASRLPLGTTIWIETRDRKVNSKLDS